MRGIELATFNLQMAKISSSAIGIDLGRYAVKSVLLQRRGGNRFLVSNFAVRPTPATALAGESLSGLLRSLLAELGGSSKACSVALSSADMLIRVIEQPDTPPALLRNALRLNGMTLLNQEVKDYVIDCDQLPPPDGEPKPPASQRQYLVGGVPRNRIEELHQGFEAAHRPLNRIQLAPVSAFNAFEFAKPDIFQKEPFILIDMGHASSTVTVGVKGTLVLVRTLEYGGRMLLDALAGFGGDDPAAALKALEAGDELLGEAARMSLAALTRELSSSIGFFEARREETIAHVFVSGGLARSQVLLNLMSEELNMPCEAWHPFERCEITVPAARKSDFAKEAVNLNVACGAAVELLRGN